MKKGWPEKCFVNSIDGSVVLQHGKVYDCINRERIVILEVRITDKLKPRSDDFFPDTSNTPYVEKIRYIGQPEKLINLIFLYRVPINDFYESPLFLYQGMLVCIPYPEKMQYRELKT